MTKMKQSMTAKTVEIDFLFLDLETCTRCKGADASLEAALNAVTSVLTSAGVNISVRKTLVDTEKKMPWRWASSRATFICSASPGWPAPRQTAIRRHLTQAPGMKA